MHGSFGRRDVHNTLVASGPDFKAGYSDHLPTGNVDVAPTVAYLLGLDLPGAAGRVLHEALRKDATPAPKVVSRHVAAPIASGLVIQNPTDPNGNDVDLAKTTYYGKVFIQTLTEDGGKSYDYFDHADGIRR